MRPITTHSYVARKSCGCIADVVIDDPTRKDEVTAQVAAWEARGLRVARVTHKVVADEIGVWCGHKMAQV